MTKPAIVKARSSRRVQIIDITEDVARAIRDSGVTEGICVLQSLHTTAALTVNESADPDVRRDIEISSPSSRLGIRASATPRATPTPTSRRVSSGRA